MATPSSANSLAAQSAALRRYNLLLLAVAGLGGLLYGIDVGIIGGAYPYLAATSGLTAATSSVRSDDPEPIAIDRSSAVPANRVEAFFKNPFGDLDAAQAAPLRIEKAVVGSVPDARHGWLVALGLYVFMAFFAMGPGVCVWLALSELMPTRIRSNGMSVALVINQLVSTTLAAIFLPFVSRHGYSSMFFLCAGFTVIYLLTAALFLPETKGKTLEEIEAYFEGRKTPCGGS